MGSTPQSRPDLFFLHFGFWSFFCKKKLQNFTLCFGQNNLLKKTSEKTPEFFRPKTPESPVKTPEKKGSDHDGLQTPKYVILKRVIYTLFQTLSGPFEGLALLYGRLIFSSPSHRRGCRSSTQILEFPPPCSKKCSSKGEKLKPDGGPQKNFAASRRNMTQNQWF